MTKPQFKVHWQRLVDKYPKHFQSDDHRDREYKDWYDNFIRLDDSITKQAFDYYFRHLATNWFPEIKIMRNVYHTTETEKAAYTKNHEPCQEFSKEQNMVFKQQYYKDLEDIWPGNTERFARKNGKEEAMREILGDELYDSIPEKPKPISTRKNPYSNVNFGHVLTKLKKHYSGTKSSN